MMRTTLIAVGIVAVLAVGYYAISPLFITIKADDALPQVLSNTGTGGTQSATPPPAASVVGTPGHPASGTVRIVTDGDTSYVRYEDFKTINGPDIYVYLSKDLAATDFINLGRVKATEGNVNYEIPVGVSVGDYPYVLTWCKQFSVLFNSAHLP